MTHHPAGWWTGAGIVLAIGVGSCCPLPPDAVAATPPAPVVVALSPPPPPVVVIPRADFETAAVHRDYGLASAQEPAAVAGPAATAVFVRRVHAADIVAREALRALSDGHARPPSRSALLYAQAAVKQLWDVLGEGLVATPR